MNTFTIVCLVSLLAIYLWLSEYYLKRHLGIRSKWTWMFAEDRYKISMITDIVLVVSFIYSFLSLNIDVNSENNPIMMKVSPIFALFFLQNLNQGIEERLRNFNDKAYYHQFLGSFMIGLSYLIFLIGHSR
ncbi:DUF4181 domain-containing protein [Anaerobacillus sp. 1_MG-2023]|uniref:DUF4181 domain-containing protein n=1 Tax=Anaerobacillus sp. 1_MG-2023 TaxID=3062655 RepID=UPI0026E1A7CE|nr:DUF4181 domain-containing protein [Anaerobacillus sp. 1_MG-2023]MDO6654635.1 DUF4181 domain-containing protein [Anaerobacillus sp. 1_MG-2023]